MTIHQNLSIKNKIGWTLFFLSAVAVGLYPITYYFVDRNFGLFYTKSDELLADGLWKVLFYLHISLGGIALLTGWPQFIKKFRNKFLKFHRRSGKIYVIAVLVSAISGIYIAFFATGGMISSLGFIFLGITWFYTTFMAYLHIKNKKLEQHQNMMVFIYAVTFAAVTLRIWLPLLEMVVGNFLTAYHIVAWLCWLPNFIVAQLIVKHLSRNERNLTLVSH